MPPKMDDYLSVFRSFVGLKFKDHIIFLNYPLITFWVLGFMLVFSPYIVAQLSDGADPIKEVERILGQLVDNSILEEVPKQTYKLSETDLNGYLSFQIKKTKRKGLKNVSVSLKEGGFVTVVEMNMSQIQLKDKSLTASMLSVLLQGAHTLEVEGQLNVQEGIGKYQVQQASLDGIELPASMVEMVLSTLGRQQDPPFDPVEPFPMPYGISTVDVQLGRVTIETG